MKNSRRNRQMVAQQAIKPREKPIASKYEAKRAAQRASALAGQREEETHV